MSRSLNRNITQDESAMAELEKLGVMTTPVAVVDGETTTDSPGQRTTAAPMIR